eukprot:3232071-Rhodomonas_salina.1
MESDSEGCVREEPTRQRVQGLHVYVHFYLSQNISQGRAHSFGASVERLSRHRTPNPRRGVSTTGVQPHGPHARLLHLAVLSFHCLRKCFWACDRTCAAL